MRKPNLFNFIKDIVSSVKRKNQEDPNVATAPPTVFDEMTRKVEEVEHTTSTTQSDDLVEALKRKMAEVKSKNEANPNEATADKSIFEDMLGQLDKIRNQENQTTAHPAPEVTFTEITPPESEIPVSFEEVKPDVPATAAHSQTDEAFGTMAMTNSMGGSLGLRNEPEMGSPEIQFRIPDSSIVKIIRYSEKSIVLDGVKARWVLVSFGERSGWTLESYLNFN